ncbi:hypothetical protein U0070_005906, partial [Myodes glareolus]
EGTLNTAVTLGEDTLNTAVTLGEGTLNTAVTLKEDALNTAVASVPAFCSSCSPQVAREHSPSR